VSCWNTPSGNGRYWKRELREAWMKASEQGPLHNLRNVAYFGPTGLINFRIYKDAQGNAYSGEMPYYQAVQKDGTAPDDLIDKNGNTWPSYAVWKNKQTCDDLFPDLKPETYYGAEIEEPVFCDGFDKWPS
jgi:hypothetical protein